MWRALAVLLCSACSDPGSGSGTPTPPAETSSPTPEPTAPAMPPATPPASGALADPARVPFELRVEPGTTPRPEDQAWIDLLRAGLPQAQHPPPDRGWLLRARDIDLFGTPIVQLSVHPDGNGASGQSRYGNVALIRVGGEWQYVEPRWDDGEPLEITRRSGARSGDAAPADEGERATRLDRGESLRPEIARAMLAMPDSEMAVRQLLGHVRSLHAPDGSFRIALRRNEVPRDVEWNPGRTFVPWVVQRRGDVITGSGMFLMERDWYRFSLRVEGSGLTLEHERIARASSRGVPP